MNYSIKSDRSHLLGSDVQESAPPLASSSGDPYLALDQLMVVVEALCPVWPSRPTFVDAGEMRL
jgi:hypothetical protein